jgi:hypothetical protein
LRAKNILVNRKAGNRVFYSVRDPFHSHMTKASAALKAMDGAENSSAPASGVVGASDQDSRRGGCRCSKWPSLAHCPPHQGRIGVFVHHNTLQAFEHPSWRWWFKERNSSARNHT